MTTGYNFFPTAGEIILSALELLRVNDMENALTPTSAQYTRAIQALNFMLTGWQNQGLQLWSKKSTTLTLVQSKSSYTFGSFAGADINLPKALRLYNVMLRETTSSTSITDTPIEILPEKDYQRLSNKFVDGRPTSCWYDPRYELGANFGASTLGIIYIYQPAAAQFAGQQLVISYQRPWNDFNAITDLIDFPQEWLEAVKYNLAVRLAPVYGQPMLEYDRMKKLADDILLEAQGGDKEDTSIYIQPANRHNSR